MKPGVGIVTVHDGAVQSKVTTVLLLLYDQDSINLPYSFCASICVWHWLYLEIGARVVHAVARR